MQNLIQNSGMDIKEFAITYRIPYNTVRQWANGTRKAPIYVKKLIEENLRLKTKGVQLKIKEEICQNCEKYENITWYSGNCKINGIKFTNETCENFCKKI